MYQYQTLPADPTTPRQGHIQLGLQQQVFHWLILIIYQGVVISC